MNKQWIAIKAGITIIALQHCCGVNDAPVNCHLDGHGNWECPGCFTTFGAPVTIATGLSVEFIHQIDEDDDA